MRKQLIAVTSLALLLVAGSAISSLAQTLKIGYIDSIKIFAENKETQDAERVYRNDVQQWEAQKQRYEADIAKMGEELNAQSPMLSEEKKAEPGRAVTVCLPALIRSGSSCPRTGKGPMPSRPFSDCSITSMLRGTWLATSVGMPMPRFT